MFTDLYRTDLHLHVFPISLTYCVCATLLGCYSAILKFTNNFMFFFSILMWSECRLIAWDTNLILQCFITALI